ncbi:hypothetical protein RhiJN_01895 [Ceratobasidium sp. AG-Ba]|nr:hypothetical protein RhiJN_01895 [Ceratobasidium sp. AG-Ba]
MFKRLRHKFNTEKNQGKKKRGKQKFTAPVGNVELYETYKGIRRRHRGQGYLHAEQDTPYSRDLSISELMELISTKIVLYPEIDYGAYTNEEREWVQLNTTGDLEDLVDMLMVKTGAQIWMVAECTHMYHSVVSSGSQRWLKMDSCTSAVEEFVQFQHERSILLPSPDVDLAPPAVYASFDGSFVPQIPVCPRIAPVLNELLFKYLQSQWAWQFGKRPFEWELGNEDIEDEDRIVDPARLPHPVTHITNTNTWVDEWSLSFWDHLWAGQRGEIPLDRQFQYLQTRLCHNPRF